MKEETSPQLVFAQVLNHISLLEKQVVKLYEKLEKAAFTPELSKALSPNQTESEQHLQRLILIKELVKGQKIDKDSKPSHGSLKFSLKSSSTAQDLDMIAKVLELQNLKLSYYEFLHPIAVALDMETAASLIEQTITDNRNTNTWLRQIIQNVIIPVIK
jgi:ferritin-like metal-binding protein YciE